MEENYLDYSEMCMNSENYVLALEILETGLAHIPHSYRLLIQKGADVKARGPAGATGALIAASKTNDTAMMKFLLEQGADAKAKGMFGFTALMGVSAYGNVEMVKLLLARGGDVNAQSDPVFEKVKNGNIGIGSLTPLLMSVTAGSPEVVRMLLDAGADINVRDVRGMTPVMLSVATDHPALWADGRRRPPTARGRHGSGRCRSCSVEDRR